MTRRELLDYKRVTSRAHDKESIVRLLSACARVDDHERCKVFACYHSPIGLDGFNHKPGAGNKHNKIAINPALPEIRKLLMPFTYINNVINASSQMPPLL